jgi:hypothetical protein
MTCQSGQTSPQAMAAAFGAEGSSPASRWQLRPSLRFDYEHGDNKTNSDGRYHRLGKHTHTGSRVAIGTSVTDVRHLASASMLKQLDLNWTKVTTEGTMGLERIPTLETLRLRSTLVTDVRHLASAKALKQLDLSNTKVTTEGTMGLERIPTLETLRLWSHVGHGRAASGIGEGVEAPRPQQYKGDDGGHDGAGTHTHAGNATSFGPRRLRTCGIWHRRRR